MIMKMYPNEAGETDAGRGNRDMAAVSRELVPVSSGEPSFPHRVFFRAYTGVRELHSQRISCRPLDYKHGRRAQSSWIVNLPSLPVLIPAGTLEQ